MMVYYLTARKATLEASLVGFGHRLRTHGCDFGYLRTQFFDYGAALPTSPSRAPAPSPADECAPCDGTIAYLQRTPRGGTLD